MGPLSTTSQTLAGLPGKTLGDRYQIEGLVAFGGMGALFRATHLALHKPVAVKVLHPQLSADEMARKRFEREAQSASRLEHRNCVLVMDYGTEGELSYLVMEFLEGAELTSVLGNPMKPALALDRAGQILAGLEHAHERGVIHRDLKPGNIHVARDAEGEVIKLVDFGIAKLLDDTARQKLTQTGFVLGTPRYMSPEQARGDDLDGRSDLYAVGLLLYEMLVGWPPFQALDVPRMLQKQLHAAPEPLPPELPKALRRFVLKLLAKKPDGRYETASAALDDLRKLQQLVGDIAAAPKRPPSMGLPDLSEASGSRAADSAADTVMDPTVEAGDHPAAASAARSVAAGSMHRGTAPEGSAAAMSSSRSASPSRSSALPWTVAAVLAVALVALMAHVLLREPMPAPAAAPAPAVVPAAAQADVGAVHAPAAAGPATAPEAEVSANVTVTVTTPGVSAEIRDDEGHLLGPTNEGPLEIPRGSELILLTVRADGHRDEVLNVIPNRNKKYLVELQPLPTRSPAKPKKRTGGKPRPAPDMKDPFNKAKAPKPEAAPLTNPFAR